MESRCNTYRCTKYSEEKSYGLRASPQIDLLVQRRKIRFVPLPQTLAWKCECGRGDVLVLDVSRVRQRLNDVHRLNHLPGLQTALCLLAERGAQLR